MIEILENNEKYVIDADFNIKGKDKEFREFLKATIDCILMDYDMTKGFPTSYAVYELKNMKFNILNYIDEEMENAEEGRVY